MSDPKQPGKDEDIIRILFLDIDGVLNSSRTVLAYGHAWLLTHKDRLDHVALDMLRKLVNQHGIRIVLSSSWRLAHDYHDVANMLDLPIIGQTPALAACRGEEIALWLKKHIWVKYVIVDDCAEMLEEQMANFVYVSGENGLNYRNLLQICSILEVEPPFMGSIEV